MTKSKLGAVGLGLVGLGSTLLASPANAALSCGTAPTGGTITSTNDYCQLTFSTAGSYNVTIPAAATELYAIVVGSGEGAGVIVDTNGAIAYAGTGGQVKYLNLTDQIDTPISVNVGAGGVVSDNYLSPSGTDTTLTYSSTGASAYTGNYPRDIVEQCIVPNYTSGLSNYLLFYGMDGKGRSRVTATGQSCDTANGLGINPSLGDTDNDGNPVPAIFANYNHYLGAGGAMSIDGTTASNGFGAGGSMSISSTDGTFSNVSNGKDGAVIFRWKQPAELAATGSDSSMVSVFGGALVTTGVASMMVAKTRRRVAR